MNRKILNSINAQQDTLTLLKNSTDMIPISATPVNNNFHKTISLINKQNEVKVNTPVDTVIHDPLFLKIKNNDKSLIDNYNNFYSLSYSNDSNCYIIKKQVYTKSKPVFIIDKSESKSYIRKDYIIKEKISISNDWTIIPILLGLFLLASIVAKYRKYLGILFESIIYRLSSSKILNEKSSQVQRLSFILDFIYIITFSLTIDQALKGLGFISPTQKIPFIVFIAIFAFLVCLKLFRLIVINLYVLFSNQRVFLYELFNSSLLYTRTLGLFLLPVVFLVTYSTGNLNLILIYFSLLIIFIMLILRLISMFRAFIVGGFSIFYFILYLCALEIIPLLVIWKEVNSR